MSDIYLEWNSDLSVNSNGDLALVNGTDQTNQRVIRRLLTNPGDYIWNGSYGGGLALFVGSPVDPRDIEAVMRSQLALEAEIPLTPTALVAVRSINPADGSLITDITYADSTSTSLVNLTVSTNL